MTIALFFSLLLTSTLLIADMHGDAPIAVGDTSLGKVLTDQQGMTLYTFTRDTSGTSNCNDGCAANWPPLMAGDGAMAAGDFSIIMRSDGSKQWAYKDMPLYTWVRDTEPGDVTGHEFNQVWFVVPVE
ncbi:COG4315 family predicted lipoprotein [Nitrincola sp. MINF-07-Sa-05]|uniref:COG4315 family predicted lipoprotein n=1 Tax=Nitrincola salilacus TaxID=3400273 RepID=UPI003918391D